MKKIIAMIICATVMVSALAGCKEKKTGSIIQDKPSGNVTATTAVPQDDTSSAEASSTSATASANGLTFSTTDIDGNAVSMDTYKAAKVIMLNFWEPWCGPCVGEMPSLAKLYNTYKADGLVILGAYSTPGQDDNVRQVMEQSQVTYPIIRTTASMESLMTEYVPTTVFLDANGNVLTNEPLIGSRSEADWEKIIKQYLGK